MIDTRTLCGPAALALALSLSLSSPVRAGDGAPAWTLLTTLFRAAVAGPQDTLSDAERAELERLKPNDEQITRLLDGESIARVTAVRAAMRPVYQQGIQAVQGTVGGYHAVQDTVGAAVNYWTGQQPQQAQQPASYGDPYGFTAWLNGVRAQYGLAPVSYDADLSAWANMNNAQQQSMGLGHHVMGPARRQNSAMGNAASIGGQWLASPAHAAALLDPTIRVIGIAGMGAYWTFNAY